MDPQQFLQDKIAPLLAPTPASLPGYLNPITGPTQALVDIVRGTELKPFGQDTKSTAKSRTFDRDAVDQTPTDKWDSTWDTLWGRDTDKVKAKTKQHHDREWIDNNKYREVAASLEAKGIKPSLPVENGQVIIGNQNTGQLATALEMDKTKAESITEIEKAGGTFKEGDHSVGDLRRQAVAAKEAELQRATDRADASAIKRQDRINKGNLDVQVKTNEGNLAVQNAANTGAMARARLTEAGETSRTQIKEAGATNRTRATLKQQKLIALKELAEKSKGRQDQTAISLETLRAQLEMNRLAEERSERRDAYREKMDTLKIFQSGFDGITKGIMGHQLSY